MSELRVRALTEPAASGEASGARARQAYERNRVPSLMLLFSVPSILFVVIILLLPLVAIVWRTFDSGVFLVSIRKPVVYEALRLTTWTSAITLLLSILFGMPLAYVLARATFPGKRVVDTLVDLPIVLPPVVAGVGLLMAFGRRGLVGQWIQADFTLPVLGIQVPGISLSFSTTAVILAQLFVSAPFFIRAARSGFSHFEREVEEAAELDGASPWQIFRLVTVPLAAPALSSGLVLCWARAVGEFGATMMFAGNFIGRTQTMPLAIMGAMESDLYAALAISLLLITLSFVTLFIYRLVGSRRGLEL